MKERSVLRKGIISAFGTGKAAARHLGYSEEMISKIFTGERNIAPDQQPRWSGTHLMAGMAIAEEATGYRCFDYIDGDRHPQVMIRRVEKEDAEADEALKRLPWMLLDKQGPDDLTEDDRHQISVIGKELCDRIQVDLNLIVELDDRFQIGLVQNLVERFTERKRPLCAAR